MIFMDKHPCNVHIYSKIYLFTCCKCISICEEPLDSQCICNMKKGSTISNQRNKALSFFLNFIALRYYQPYKNHMCVLHIHVLVETLEHVAGSISYLVHYGFCFVLFVFSGP